MYNYSTSKGLNVVLAAVGIVALALFGLFAFAPSAHAILACSPAHTTVSVGQTVFFTASGIATTTFDWGSPNQSVSNIGASFSEVFWSAGTQTVVVQTNDGQSAVCVVEVIGGTGGPDPGPPATGGGGTLLPVVVPLGLLALLGAATLYAIRYERRRAH